MDSGLLIFLSQCSKNLKLSTLDGVYQVCYNCIKTTNTVDDTRSTIYHPIGGGHLISLNYRDSRPIYEQIKDNYKKLILSGAIGPDERLPSVRELAAQLAINPNTIQRAYRELESEGIVYTVPGKGSFAGKAKEVEEGRKQQLLSEFDQLAAQLLLMGVSKEELQRRIDPEGGR